MRTKMRSRGLSDWMRNILQEFFVWSEAQSRGIGKCLLDWVKEEKRKLTLNVYARNPGAVRFYQREGFRIAGEDTDEDTGEKEHLMCWEAEKDSDSICD